MTARTARKPPPPTSLNQPQVANLSEKPKPQREEIDGVEAHIPRARRGVAPKRRIPRRTVGITNEQIQGLKKLVADYNKTAKHPKEKLTFDEATRLAIASFLGEKDRKHLIDKYRPVAS